MEEDIKQSNKLYRSRSDRYLGGVCGGIAEYFNIDSNLTRILFVIGSFLWGIGVVLYLAALILVPENPNQTSESSPGTGNTTMFWGLLFIVIGFSLLAWELDLFNFFRIVDLPWQTLWAFFLIGIGLAILYAQWKKKSESENAETDLATDAESGGESGDLTFKIYRSRTDRKISGVCGGVAAYFNIDSTIVRLAWILLTIASKGLGVLIYIIFIFIFPEESSEQTI
jgi:phage shock protein PspC (stress-responsive transcriptional regulator)